MGEPNISVLKHAPQHMGRKGISGVCNVTYKAAHATPALLDQLVDELGSIDLLHVDIQGAEGALLHGSTKLHRIKRLHVGTHGRDVHRALRSRLQDLGFALEWDLVGDSFLQTAFGWIPLSDGVL